MHPWFVAPLQIGHAQVAINPDTREGLGWISGLNPDAGETITPPCKWSNNDSGHGFLLPNTRTTSLTGRGVRSPEDVFRLGLRRGEYRLSCGGHSSLTRACCAL
jgi:hypothetical protein